MEQCEKRKSGSVGVNFHGGVVEGGVVSLGSIPHLSSDLNNKKVQAGKGLGEGIPGEGTASAKA